MRKLAAALDASPMSLYTYYPDREAVLEALTQLVLAEVDGPDEDLDWRETIRQIMRSIRRVGLRHPHVAPLINRFPPRTPDALAFVEAGFRAFCTAGRRSPLARRAPPRGCPSSAPRRGRSAGRASTT